MTDRCLDYVGFTIYCASIFLVPLFLIWIFNDGTQEAISKLGLNEFDKANGMSIVCLVIYGLFMYFLLYTLWLLRCQK